MISPSDPIRADLERALSAAKKAFAEATATAWKTYVEATATYDRARAVAEPKEVLE